MTGGSAQHTERLTRDNALLLLVDHQVGLRSARAAVQRVGLRA